MPTGKHVQFKRAKVCRMCTNGAQVAMRTTAAQVSIMNVTANVCAWSW